MRLIYTGNKINVRAAADFANDLIGDAEFLSRIEAKTHFDESEYTGAQIARAIREHTADVSVIVKATVRWYVNGWTERGTPAVIFYNRFKTNRPVGGIVNTLVHELVHVVDNSEVGRPEEGFGHSDNDEEGKENCAPNWIGDLAEEFYDSRN